MQRSVKLNSTVALLMLTVATKVIASTSAETYADKGDKYFKAHDYPSAIVAYNKSIALDPSRGLTYYGLALCYHQQEQWELAVAAWKRTRSLLQPEAAMFMILGTDYFHLKRYGEALEQFWSAADLESNQKVLATIQYWIGVTYKAQNQPDQAIAPLKEAIRLNPDDADFYFELGTAYLAMNKKDDALRVYRDLRPIDDSKAQELHAEILLHDERAKRP